MILYFVWGTLLVNLAQNWIRKIASDRWIQTQITVNWIELGTKEKSALRILYKLSRKYGLKSIKKKWNYTTNSRPEISNILKKRLKW